MKTINVTLTVQQHADLILLLRCGQKKLDEIVESGAHRMYSREHSRTIRRVALEADNLYDMLMEARFET